MSFYPTSRNPLTDMTTIIAKTDNQNIPASHCAKNESRMWECYDSYGMDLGKYKCKDYKDDYLECMHRFKQHIRSSLMRKERHRQYLFGKRQRQQLYDEPPTLDVHFWW